MFYDFIQILEYCLAYLAYLLCTSFFREIVITLIILYFSQGSTVELMDGYGLAT